MLFSGTALAANERHQVVGLGDGSVLWSRGVLTHLGRPAGTMYFEAQDINNRTQIVGNTSDGAFRWQRGTFVRLPLPAGGTPGGTTAYGINDRGQIVGSAELTSPDGPSVHAILRTR